MSEQLFGNKLLRKDVSDIIEVYALRHKDLKSVVSEILVDLRRDQAGETISFTLHHAVERLTRIGYKPEDIAKEFASTEFASEVNERLEKITNNKKP